MNYIGDIPEDATIRGSFNTRDAAGAPITIAGTPAISVYKDAGTTESTAGVTLTVDFDSRTGFHVFAIDTSADAFYATGSDYQVVITTGTVDGTSVVGTCVARFSIENRYSAAGGSGLDADGIRAAIGLASANLDTQLSTIDGVVDAILVDTNELQTNQGNWLTADVSGLATASALATVDSNVDAILTDTGTTIPAQIAALNDTSAAEVITAMGTGTFLTAIPWNASWDAEVQSECADALNAYDPPTRTEATSDKAEIITELEKVPRAGAGSFTHTRTGGSTGVDEVTISVTE